MLGAQKELTENQLSLTRIASFPHLQVTISCEGASLSIPSEDGFWGSFYSLTAIQQQEAFQWLANYAAHKETPLFPWMQLYNNKGTKFDKLVWKSLKSIPFGQTLTYLNLAKAIGKKTAARAVGSACGRNPMPLFIPCHRIVRSNGCLGGFSLGQEIKKRLLMFEAAQ